MKRWIGCVALLGLLSAPLGAFAQVEFVGTVGYALQQNGSVALTVDRIANRGNQTTGTLHLTLWATVSANPIGQGYILARRSLAINGGDGRLRAGASFVDIRVFPDYSPPPQGTWYYHLYVSQAPSLNAVLDAATFPRRVTIGPPEPDPDPDPDPDPGPPPPGGGLAITGGSYEIRDGQARLSVNRIVNNRRAGTRSGTLYLQLWAKESHDAGSFHRLASVQVGTLDGGSQLTGFSEVGTYVAPPRGKYYLSLVLVEYPDLNQPKSTIGFDKPQKFGSKSGSSSSALQADALTALLVALAACRVRRRRAMR